MRNLDSLTIYRFRGLRDLELTKLGQITILTGTSGKTSILEAIAAYCIPLDPVGWVGLAWQREVKVVREPFLDSLRWLFPQDQVAVRSNLAQGEILLAGEGLFSVRRLQATFQPFEGIWASPPEDAADPPQEELLGFERAANLVLEVDRVTLTGQRESIVRIHELWEHRPLLERGQVTDPVLTAVLVTATAHQLEAYPMDNLTETLGDFQEDLLQLLQAFDPQIRGLEVLALRGQRLGLYLRHKQLGLSPLAIFGEHIRRLVCVGLNLYRAQGGILLLDGLEVALPPDQIPTFLSWLVTACSQWDVQLFATTHQGAEVYAISAPSTEDFVIYQLEQNEFLTSAHLVFATEPSPTPEVLEEETLLEVTPVVELVSP